VVALCLLVLVSAGCLVWEPRDTRGVRIFNDSDEAVTVLVLYPARESVPARETVLTVYQPGESSIENNMLSAADGCTSFVMVARTEDGREIDRQDPPICRDEEWRIQEDS
jgi:hypothetical protein